MPDTLPRPALAPVPAGEYRGRTWWLEVIELPESRSWHGLASVRLPAEWPRPAGPVEVGAFVRGYVGRAIVRAAEFEGGRWTVEFEGVGAGRLWREAR